MTTYHFTGIKGSGMSSLAQILHDVGHTVQGSDKAEYFFTEKPLHERGIAVYEFEQAQLTSEMVVIAGNAYPDHHPELEKARQAGAKIMRYHTFLGDYMSRFTSVAVTGAHGKTSTTGLLSHVLNVYSPTSYLIGDGTGNGLADAENFVFEACEYRRHFLAYHPDYAVMTNIDFDHPDYFTSKEDVFNAFQEMAVQVNKAIFACGDDDDLLRITASVPVIYYGLNSGNDFQATAIEKTPLGTSFDVVIRDEFYHRFHIPMYGDHTIQNALAVISLCHFEGIPPEAVAEGLSTFGGVKRRFTETLKEQRVLIDDYAHHPTEITATIQSARQKYPEKEVIAVFQPHTFSRTAKFLDEFAESLGQADTVYLCEIFASAREAEGELTIHDLQKLIPTSKILVENNVTPLLDHPTAVYLFMGAGDVQKFQAAFEKLLN
ncbi:UDP-N-acetylmuramate--L-alanine ligase [Chryseomicrobium sp. FSL W7-1435]|uniref:UDP-N-acetylmuramate--L-alanine ligase n=1 Tax=Chryseomicrobium sp. FSL W7-1435 TaxID=2921704 RepID=UPI003159A93D